MSIKMTKGGSASEADIAALEEFLGTTLPKELKTFLTKHDGAEPETNIFQINEQNDSGVNRFIPAREVLRERERIENLASRAFPIAWAEGGNFVLIDMNAGGEVQFWDHETGDITMLANSFDSFLSALRPFDVDDIELKPGQVKSVWVDPDFLKNLGDE